MAPGFRLQTLKSALLDGSLTAGLNPDDTIAALEGVSFKVEKGRAFGVIGSNGSGKSTLLKILTGMLKPTTGRVEVDGRVAALIDYMRDITGQFGQFPGPLPTRTCVAIRTGEVGHAGPRE